MVLRYACRFRCSRYRQIIQGRILKMSSHAQTPDHLQRTAESSRQKIMSSATVLNIQDESRTVKSLNLKIHNENFRFKAGQWVDTFIPGVDTVTGFSMCSSPGLLQRDGMMHLAVKRSSHPPAEWVHTKCKVGSQVNLRVGGDYFYDPQTGEDPPTDLLLVAGGVGINPLMSMLNHIHDMHQSETSRSMCPNKVILMFSAKTNDELLFRKRINELCNVKPNNMSAVYFITEETGATEDNTVCSRIKQEHVQEATDKLNSGKVECYLCGPSPMIADIETMLKACGITESSIHYERWW
ncbi:oxidoreductase NAD-binding domain-containing protein 1-like isoform X2 [Haliotis asinina]|uniref:oxidoreductase NAD-binding domain-containing protein 1-like isoform X2 n=1 Tax=Haliotis asinina TaxID=109174 RepID=UPI0035320998